jgi:FeS assembly SUF system protein
LRVFFRENLRFKFAKICENFFPYLCKKIIVESSSQIHHSPFEAKIIAALRSVFDPEIPVNIYDLGLIYNLQIDDQTSDVYILMTLTSPNCPVAEDMPLQVQETVKMVEGVGTVKVELTFEPPWDKDMLSESALLELGLL